MKFTTETLIEFFDEEGFNVHLFMQDEEQCAEVEKWTDGGVDMIFALQPFTATSFIDRVSEFNVDDEIVTHRMADDYKIAFTLSESLEDFTKFHNGLKEVVSNLEKLIQSKKEITDSFIDTLLWLVDDDYNGTHDGLGDEAKEEIDEYLNKVLILFNEEDVKQYFDVFNEEEGFESFGKNLWFSVSGQGCGLWEYENGKFLDDKLKENGLYGCSTYLGDDNMIYVYLG